MLANITMHRTAIIELLQHEGFENVRFSEEQGFLFDLDIDVHTGWVKLIFDQQHNMFKISCTEFKTVELDLLLRVSSEITSFTACMIQLNDLI